MPTANELKIKIHLIGWHNQGAHGDDLLAFTVRKLFDTIAAEMKVRIHWVDRPHEAEYFLVGGGTLLGVDNMGILHMVETHGKPFSIFGTGFRRERRDIGEKHKRLLETLMNKADFIFLRGYTSKQFCVHAGIQHGEVVGDPALQFEKPIEPQQDEPLFKKIGISIRSLDSQAEPQYTTNLQCAEIVISIAEWLSKRDDCQFFFYNLAENIYDSDLIAIKEIIHRIPENRPHKVIAHSTGALEQFSRISQMDYIISQRLHPSVIGWTCGIPHIALDYQNCKTADFMSTLGMQEFSMRTDEFSITAYRTQYDRLRQDEDIVAQHAARAVAYWREKQRDGARLILEKAVGGGQSSKTTLPHESKGKRTIHD